MIGNTSEEKWTPEELEMLKKRPAFLFYMQWCEGVMTLDDATAGQIFKAVAEYQLTGEVQAATPVAKAMLLTYLSQFKTDKRNYITKCQKAQKAIQTRWEKARADKSSADTDVPASNTDVSPSNTDEYERIQTNTDVYERIPENTDVYERIPTYTDVSSSNTPNTKYNYKYKNKYKYEYEKHGDHDLSEVDPRELESEESGLKQQEEFDFDVLSGLFERVWKCLKGRGDYGKAFEAFSKLMEDWDYESTQYDKLVMACKAYEMQCDDKRRPAKYRKSVQHFLTDEEDGYEAYWPGSKNFLKWYPVADPESVKIPETKPEDKTQTKPEDTTQTKPAGIGTFGDFLDGGFQDAEEELPF